MNTALSTIYQAALSRRYRVATIITIGMVLFAVALRIIAIQVVPVHQDANFYMNIAVNNIFYGELTPRMWRLPEETNIIAGSGTGYGVLLLTSWMRVFGVSVLSGRILMTILWLVLIGVMVGVGWTWWQDRYIAATLGFLTLVSTTPLFATIVRMDMPGYLAYACVLWGFGLAHRQPNPRWHFLVGGGLVVAAEFHILATVYIVALTFVYVVEHFTQNPRQQWRHLQTPLVWYALGGVVAGGIYAVIHILPSPQAYFFIPSMCPACEGRSLQSEVERITEFFSFRPIEATLFVLGIVAALFRRTAADRRLLLLLLGIGFAYPIINPPPQIDYILHMAPIFVMVIGTLAASGFRKHLPLPRRIFYTHTVGLIFLAVNALPLWFLVQRPNAIPMPIQVIEAYDLPTDTVIMGEYTLYHYLLPYHDFLQIGNEDIYTPTLRNESFMAYWSRESPQVFIGDPNIREELPEYLTQNNFQEIVDNLWFSGRLCEEVDCSAVPG